MAISKAAREAADKAKKEKAEEFALEIEARLLGLRKERSLNELAALFNKKKVPTPSGKGKWSYTTVKRTLAKIAAKHALQSQAAPPPGMLEPSGYLVIDRETGEPELHPNGEPVREIDVDRDDWRTGEKYISWEELPTKERVEAQRVFEEERERNKTPEQRQAEIEAHDAERNAKRRSQAPWWNQYEKRYTIKRPLTHEEWRIVDDPDSGRKEVEELLRSRVPKP